MKMRSKTKWYLALGLSGIVLALFSQFGLGDVLTNAQSGAAVGVGFGVFGFGIAKWRFSRREEKDPEFMKTNQIEANDERNIALRHSAQAVSGEILQWLVMAGAWISIFMDAPLWVTLSFVAAFLLKTVLDFSFLAYYSQKM